MQADSRNKISFKSRILSMFPQAANDMYFKRLMNNFLQKLI